MDINKKKGFLEGFHLNFQSSVYFFIIPFLFWSIMRCKKNLSRLNEKFFFHVEGSFFSASAATKKGNEMMRMKKKMKLIQLLFDLIIDAKGKLESFHLNTNCDWWNEINFFRCCLHDEDNCVNLIHSFIFCLKFSFLKLFIFIVTCCFVTDFFLCMFCKGCIKKAIITCHVDSEWCSLMDVDCSFDD